MISAQATQDSGIDLAGDNRPGSWLASSWWQQLQPGSWRGVGFVMDAAENRAGRRVALHEYPYRDTVWPEDLGKLPRRFAFQAFLVGDDVYRQRNAMVAACEQAGPGTLVHPTMGTVTCTLLEFSTTDRRERGRMVEVAFQFVVGGDQLLPVPASSTGAAVGDAAAGVNTASASDLGLALGALGSVPQAATRALPQFGALALQVIDDPARALGAVAGLAGYFGRYASGSRTTLLPATATIASTLADSITRRSAVLADVARLTTTVLTTARPPSLFLAAGSKAPPSAGLRGATPAPPPLYWNATEFAAAGQQLAADLVLAVSSPADAIRLLLPLCAWLPPPLPGSGPLWADAAAAQDAIAGTLRASACAALAQAALSYRPASYQDAQSVRLLVVGALDAEAIRAADAGRDATYRALRDLRAAVALDLEWRGAQLPMLIEVTTRVPMPSLAEAWTLYQDTSREPQLTASAAPAHPLFLPLEFSALAA